MTGLSRSDRTVEEYFRACCVERVGVGLVLGPAVARSSVSGPRSVVRALIRARLCSRSGARFGEGRVVLTRTGGDVEISWRRVPSRGLRDESDVVPRDGGRERLHKLVERR